MLKDFQKVELMQGEEKEVIFEITEKMLGFYTKDMRYESEPGRFVIMIGKNSEEYLEDEFELI